MKKLFFAAVLTAPFASTSVLAQVMPPAEYVTVAGTSDLYEITSSRVVLETTKDPKVRGFAEMMVDHHTRSTADLKAAAARSRVRAAPPKLMPLQVELIAQLKAEPAATRDLAYIAQQKASHGQALNVQKAYAMEGTAPPLRAAAAQIVPVVERHIAMLMTM